VSHLDLAERHSNGTRPSWVNQFQAIQQAINLSAGKKRPKSRDFPIIFPFPAELLI
jgi:hypothetical protein